MKKIRLLFSSLVVVLPLMVSCGRGGGKPEDTVFHTIKFSGTDCILNTSDGKKFTEGKYKEGAELSFTFVPVRGNANPTDSEVKIVNDVGEYFTDYSYSSMEGKLNITLSDDIVITASTSEKEKVQTIQLIGDSHIQIKEQITFVKGDFSPITVPYTIDRGFTIDNTIATPSSALSYKYSGGFNLIITPKDDSTSSKIEITSIERMVTLFNSDASTLKIMEYHYLTDSVEIGLKVKDEHLNRYRIPPNSQYFKILASDGSQPSFKYKCLTDSSAIITISDIQPVRVKTYEIKATDYRYYFEVTTDFGSFMESPDMPSPALAVRDQNFVFTLKIKERANITAHTIPYTLNIKLSDGTSLPKASYKIYCIDPSRQVATVTIYANYITDNFSIAGEATEINYFEWDFLICGAEAEGDEDEDGYMYGTSSQNDGASFYISGEQVSTITMERVIVEDLNGDIYCPNDSDCPQIYKSFSITPDGNRIILRTGPNVFYDYVAIYVSVTGYNFFGKLNWTTINKFVEKDWDQTFFNVGDSKEVMVNGLTYDVRIIGFDHDKISENEFAHMTLEFAQVITDNDLSSYSGKFTDVRIAKFENNDYDHYLNNDFKNSLPRDLSSIIKQVEKWYWHIEVDDEYNLSYHPYIFPLSLLEMDCGNTTQKDHEDDHDKPYAYYDGQDKSLRVKCPCESDSPVKYWTRSKEWISSTMSFYIKSNGDYDDSDSNTNHGYMAAFCI